MKVIATKQQQKHRVEDERVGSPVIETRVHIQAVNDYCFPLPWEIEGWEEVVKEAQISTHLCSDGYWFSGIIFGICKG